MTILQKYSASVEEGNKLGRKLGFPTANLYLTDNLSIEFGVYVVMIRYREQTLYGVANYGLRPTINDNKKTIEVFIFDFNQDLYNQQIEVNFIHKIRSEKTFSSIEQLQLQIGKDADFARKFIQNLTTN